MTDTANLNLTLPTVGGDSDAWGTELNAGLSALDAMLGGVAFGPTLSTAGGSGTFGIAAGGASGMALGSAYTKTTASWAVGTGNGSLDTGAIANSTWYHVYLMQRTDTSVVDILISLSATSPSLPASYTRARAIGSIKTDGSAHWIKFLQFKQKFIWDAGPSKDVDTSPSTSQTAVALNVPTGVQVTAHIRGFFQGSTSTQTGFLVSSTAESANTSTPLSPGHNVTVLVPSDLAANAALAFSVDILTNTSAQVNVVASNSSGSNLVRMGAYGWTDYRAAAN